MVKKSKITEGTTSRRGDGENSDGVDLVAVIWKDCYWEFDQDHGPLSLMASMTIGFIDRVNEQEDTITVASETFADGAVRHLTCLPRSWISHIYRLGKMPLPQEFLSSKYYKPVVAKNLKV